MHGHPIPMGIPTLWTSSPHGHLLPLGILCLQTPSPHGRPVSWGGRLATLRIPPPHGHLALARASPWAPTSPPHGHPQGCVLPVDTSPSDGHVLPVGISSPWPPLPPSLCRGPRSIPTGTPSFGGASLGTPSHISCGAQQGEEPETPKGGGVGWGGCQQAGPPLRVGTSSGVPSGC